MCVGGGCVGEWVCNTLAMFVYYNDNENENFLFNIIIDYRN